MNRAATFLINARYAFRPSKPRLLPRLANAVVRSSLPGPPRLRYVDFSIGYGCNLKCTHCFAATLTKRGKQRMMTPDDYRRVAREAMALGAVNFSFQGGEPLLIHDLEAVIAACEPRRNVISVTTNGTLLTSERIAELQQSGVDILTVSLDSSVPEEHDRFRGAAGTFALAMAGIRRALEAGLRVTLGTVVTHQSLRSEGITGLLRLARELRCVLYLILPVPAGRWKDARQMMLDADDLAYIEELTRSSPYIRTDLQANLGGHGCGAVKEILYLTPYGDVLPCPFLHIAMGNVFENSLAELRQRALDEPYFADYHPRCLVSTDAEFIDRHLRTTFDAEVLPVPWDEAFPDRESAAG